jgi:hypothetical protein
MPEGSDARRKERGAVPWLEVNMQIPQWYSQLLEDEFRFGAA